MCLCLGHLPNEFPEQPLRRTMATMTAEAAEFSCIVMRYAPLFLRSPRSVQQEDFFIEPVIHISGEICLLKEGVQRLTKRLVRGSKNFVLALA